MRFSIFYEHQLPQPWADGDEQRIIKESLEQIALADRLGYDRVWVVEHHFLEEYSHSSASDVFLGAVSQLTQSIRLGFGILPLPLAYHHPARVAETAATLDLMSDGRVDLGTGETSSGAELGGFGVARATTRAQWAEALDVIARMFVERPFAGVEGRFITMPPRNVVPKPLQRPHPPLWVACSRRETIRLAAEKGLGALAFSFVEPEDAKPWVDEYYDIITSERCVPGGFAINPNIALALPMMVHADEQQAIERGIDGAHFFGYALGHYYAFGEHHPGRTSIWETFTRRREKAGFSRKIVDADDAPLAVKLLREGLGSVRGAIGTPAQVRDLIARYEAAGVDEMILCLQTGRTRHEHIMEALELFAAEVMPEFAQRRPAREAAKAQRLGDAAPRALARRDPPRELTEDYHFNALDDGVPPAGPAAPGHGHGADGDGDGARGSALGALVQDRAEGVFRGFVARAGDRVLEQTVGSAPGLRVLFALMARRFIPERAAGFTGDVQYDLEPSGGGAARSWTVTIATDHATARPGPAPAPALTVKLATADFARLAGGDLDPVKAVLSGRLRLEGDFAVALKLGEMFGQ
jgi:alkanesulfonate monooxygenase SsuD/methylene tetrahydromethanopterin reductase-like flavin-dependent oxidoreductase (luciferase family)/putative sterol carrier protein